MGMAKAVNYKKVKQKADKLYSELLSLPVDTSKQEVIKKYRNWVSINKRIFCQLRIQSLDNLYDWAGIGIDFIEKWENITEKFSNQLQRESKPAMGTYKKLRGYAIDFRKNNPDLPPVPELTYQNLRIIELQNLQQWCIDAKKAAETDFQQGKIGFLQELTPEEPSE